MFKTLLSTLALLTIVTPANANLAGQFNQQQDAAREAAAEQCMYAEFTVMSATHAWKDSTYYGHEANNYLVMTRNGEVFSVGGDHSPQYHQDECTVYRLGSTKMEIDQQWRQLGQMAGRQMADKNHQWAVENGTLVQYSEFMGQIDRKDIGSKYTAVSPQSVLDENNCF